MLKNVTRTYGNNADRVLYLVWRFRWLTRSNLHVLTGHGCGLSVKQTDDIIKYLVAKKLLRKNTDFPVRVYRPSKRGCAKVGLPYLKITLAFTKFQHNSLLYQLVAKRGWSSFATEREVFRQIGWETIKREKLHLPDLVVFKKGEVVAVELERTAKSPQRYRDLFRKHTTDNIGRYYDRVEYYALPKAYNVLQRVKNTRVNPKELEGVSPGLKAALTKNRYAKFEVVSLREV